MIDIHTHILPNMDDGANSFEVSVELLKMEAEQGVKELVFTPHYYGKTTVQDFLSARGEAFKKIQNAIPPGVKTRLGAEVMMTGINDPSDESLCALAIEGTKCVLMEFPFTLRWSPLLFERVSDFIAETGYTPIIAHVERYVGVARNPFLVTQLVQMGCLIQLNSCAFTDKRLRRLALALLKHGLVHCLGSDSHDLDRRMPDYAQAKTVMERLGYEAEWKEIQWQTGKILTGETALKPYSQVRKFGWIYY
ncbi:MAG: hypothetical protein E7381_02185 [Clostridiales bacterium]|nr:hypothetical protein [Clostridiales bacterium]